MPRKAFTRSAKAKPREKRSRSASPTKKSGKKSGKRSARSATSLTRKPLDIMSAGAMQNLHYIAHDAPQALVFRGFGWDGPKLKKGGKKKKGKKKK